MISFTRTLSRQTRVGSSPAVAILAFCAPPCGWLPFVSFRSVRSLYATFIVDDQTRRISMMARIPVLFSRDFGKPNSVQHLAVGSSSDTRRPVRELETEGDGVDRRGGTAHGQQFRTYRRNAKSHPRNPRPAANTDERRERLLLPGLHAVPLPNDVRRRSDVRLSTDQHHYQRRRAKDRW